MRATDRPTHLPTTREIRDTFADEIASLGGTVPDVLDDGERLFARAVLGAETEVRPRDTIRSGIAVRAVGNEIRVHPYTFRLVCLNGAIAAHALPSVRLERLPSTDVFRPEYEIALTLDALRDATRACGARESFATVLEEMRSAVDREADVALQLMPTLARMPRHFATQVLPQILHRFAADGDRSAFGLMNAVTSVARDTRDAETRWNLEELGGTMPARLQPRVPAAPAAVSAGARRA